MISLRAIACSPDQLQSRSGTRKQWNVVHASRSASQAHLLVRCDSTSDPVPPGMGGALGHPGRADPCLLARAGVAALPRSARARDTERSSVKMTTLSMLAVPARSDEDANLRPLPWRRMAWVTWRQHRVALTAWLWHWPRRDVQPGSSACSFTTPTRPTRLPPRGLSCLPPTDERLQ